MHFIEEIIKADVASAKHNGRVLTRFPPEPNGYLHIGHAKSICLNFGMAQAYGGQTNLRFDDTNPEKEEVEYVESIKADVRWLGFHWERELYASDYFDQLYEFAKSLIANNLAYVDDSTPDQIAKEKGTPTTPGVANEFRNRTAEENLRLFEGMKNGEFAEGSRVLRAKVDLSSHNMLMRDPVIYRIKFAEHHRTGTKWCIYPLYDFAHGQSDSIEQITHSICTLEFVPHRELYDWFISNLNIYPSKQYEFARLNLTYTVMSKRKLLQLVNEKVVSGWDDPRMPTISGLRRRGYTPESIRDFCERIGIAKRDNMIDVGLLEFCVREHLNKIATRVMVVERPLKVVITNYHGEENLLIDNNPENEADGQREVPFCGEVYIDANDFMEEPPKKFHRLFPGGMVRLKGAYIIECQEVIKDAEGQITELRAVYIPKSKSGEDTSNIHVKGVLHWVSAKHGQNIEIRNYDRLLTVEDPSANDGDFKDYINKDSLHIVKAIAEPSVKFANLESKYQFFRMGYYVLDPDSQADHLIFNRTVGLKDSWAKEQTKPA